MSKIGSEKYSNSEYAPGIATYGIDGTDGKSGKNGTTVFRLTAVVAVRSC